MEEVVVLVVVVRVLTVVLVEDTVGPVELTVRELLVVVLVRLLDVVLVVEVVVVVPQQPWPYSHLSVGKQRPA